MKSAVTFLGVCCVLAAALAAPSPPVFPTTFVAEESSVLQQQGEPERTARITSYWQQQPAGAGPNRTAYHAAGGGSWTVWEYTGANGPTGTAYVVQDHRCAYYCTMTNLQCNLDDSLCSYDYKHGAKYAGKGTSPSGEPAETFTWNDMLGPIVMNIQTITVVNGTTPVYSTRKIQPFEKFLGWQNTTYISYEATAPPASAWAIPDKEYCNPGADDVCNGFDEAVRTWGPGAAATAVLLDL